MKRIYPVVIEDVGLGVSFAHVPDCKMMFEMKEDETVSMFMERIRLAIGRYLLRMLYSHESIPVASLKRKIKTDSYVKERLSIIQDIESCRLFYIDIDTDYVEAVLQELEAEKKRKLVYRSKITRQNDTYVLFVPTFDLTIKEYDLSNAICRARETIYHCIRSLEPDIPESEDYLFDQLDLWQQESDEMIYMIDIDLMHYSYYEKK